jgi:hypothetical protein
MPPWTWGSVSSAKHPVTTDQQQPQAAGTNQGAMIHAYLRLYDTV